MFDWTELRINDINEKGTNHGILLGTKGWEPTRYLHRRHYNLKHARS